MALPLETSFRCSTNHSESPSLVPILQMRAATRRASLKIHLRSQTKNIVGEAVAFHPNSVRRSVTSLSHKYCPRLPCTTQARRQTILGGKRIATRFSRCLMSVQKVLRSTCLDAAQYTQGSLLKMGASINLVLGVSNVYRDCSHRSFRSLDSPNSQQSLPLHTSPLRPGGGVGRTHDATGYLRAGPSPPAAGGMKRVRSQEDSFAYDLTPSGDDCDQPKEDGNRTKS